MKLYRVYDRLSPRHKWILVVNTHTKEHADFVRAKTMLRWDKYDNPKATAAQVGECVVEVEEYKGADDSLPASVKLDNVWTRNSPGADAMLSALVATVEVWYAQQNAVVVDRRPIGQRV